ncbi:MAG: CHASE domain-containing protein [Hyphomicrobiales bacterium]
MASASRSIPGARQGCRHWLADHVRRRLVSRRQGSDRGWSRCRRDGRGSAGALIQEIGHVRPVPACVQANTVFPVSARGALALNRFLPLAAFLVVIMVGLGMTAVIYRYEEASTIAKFESVADEAADRVRNRVVQHMTLLASAVAFFDAEHGAVSRQGFQAFVSGLDLGGQFEGIRGIGFARYVPVGSEAGIKVEIAANYRLDRDVWPAETDVDARAPIVLLEPQDARNEVAIGYDMFSEPVRRDAMKRAIATGSLQASAPVELVQEITADKQAGFLVYMPVSFAHAGAPATGARQTTGFVYAPFRAGDLHQAALSRMIAMPVEIETRDTTGGTDVLLYRTAGFQAAETNDTYLMTRKLDVAGRVWTISIHEAVANASGGRHPFALLFAFVSLLLAIALAASMRWQQMALASARELHAVSEKQSRKRI